MFNTERSAEMFDVERYPQAGLGLTMLLIFIKHAAMGKDGGGEWGWGINMRHTQSNIINMAKMIMHMVAPGFW
jgi:hypothetical protein